jgi:hypothetical protein
VAQNIKVVIDEDGNVTVDLHGYKGKGCHAVQEAISKQLGTCTKDVSKPEYNQCDTNRLKVGQ